MAVQKNFVVRNGLEVNSNLLVADSVTDSVGIGTSNPNYTLEVIGGIGATHINVIGISTVLTEFNVGTGGTVLTSLNNGFTGFGTAIPAYVVDIRSPVSTGQTALYIQGDVRITGDLSVDDISFDQATLNNLEVTGVGTIATASIDLGYVKTGIVTNLSTSGIGTIETASINLGYTNTGIVTNLITSGIGSITIAAIRDGYINTGIVTNLVTTGIASIAVGVVTNAYLTTGIVTNLVTSGIGTITTAVIGTGNINTGVITTLSGSNLNYSGIGSFGSVNTPTARITTGIVTTIDSANLRVSGIASINTGVVTTAFVNTGIITTLSGANINYSGIGSFGSVNADTGRINTGIVTNLSTSGIATITTAVVGTGNINTGVVTTISGSNLNYSGIGSFGSVNAATGRITTGIITTLTGTTLNYSGIGTIANFNSTDATITTVDATNVTATGIVTANEYTINGTTVINSSRELQNIASLDATTTATIEAAIANAPNTFQDIVVTGIASINTGVFTSLYSPTGIITTLSGANINYSGIGSFGSVNADTGRINTGIVTNLTVSGIATFQSDVKLGDNDKLYFGDGNDLEIYHNGSNSYIDDAGTGVLYIRSNQTEIQKYTGETIAQFVADSAVNLYYDNILKFETTSYGANISGVLQSQGLNSSGIATISVNSSSDALRITQTGAGNALLVEDSTNPDASPFVVNASGSVGIGTNNPTAALQIERTTDLAVFVKTTGTSNSARCELINGDGTTSGGYSYVRFNNNDTNNQKYAIGTYGDNNFQIRDEKVNSIRLLIKPDGSVGIGTDNPSHLLDVRHTNNTTYTPGNFILYPVARIHNDSTTTDSFASLAFRTATGDNAIGFKYNGTTNQSDFVIVNDGGANGVERLRITSSGLVGIGTDSPLTTIEAVNYGSGESEVARFTRKNGSDNHGLRVKVDPDANTVTYTSSGAASGHHIFATTGSNEVMRINSSGLVGIGTNNPGRLLQVYNPSANTQVNIKSATGGICELQFGDDADEIRGNVVYNCSSDYLAINGYNNNERLRITSTGNVGINSTTPLTTLDVGGTASIKVPVGTTAERPGSPATGFVRFNTDLNTFEGYNGSEWGGLGGAAEKDTAVSTTSATTCESFAVASYRSATITAQITQGSSYQVGKYVVIHDGTTATLIEESAIATGSMLGSFTATISGGNLLFQVNMSSASAATVTTLMTKVSV